MLSKNSDTLARRTRLRITTAPSADVFTVGVELFVSLKNYPNNLRFERSPLSHEGVGSQSDLAKV